MKKVVIRAPLLSKSGYGEHARQVFKYLLTVPNIELKAQCVPWGITPWYTSKEDCNGLISEIIKRSKTTPEDKFDLSLQVILPNEWDATLATKNIGITAGVETDRANPEWCSTHCEKMDLVIVPSEHAKNSLLNSGASTSTPIHVVPESYFEELNNEPDDLGLNLKTKFNFLTVGVLTGFTPDTDRKNLLYLIKWFIETFRDNADVGLVIKTNMGRETTVDKANTTAMLKKVLAELGHTGFPRVYLLHGGMSRQDMNSLYKDKSIKALVSATRGEGFGLPMLEASVAGLPVIATNWSAHTEFMNKGRWVSFEYDLVPIHEKRVDEQIFMPSSKWAMPKESSVKSSLLKFYKKGEQIPREWAAGLASTLKASHSQENITKLYNNLLKHYMD